MSPPSVKVINGALIRSHREARGWALSDMAVKSCLSIKQIKQIEENGSSSFYSESVKMTAARKLAHLLQMPPEDVFIKPALAESEQLSGVKVAQAAPQTDELMDDGHPVTAAAPASVDNRPAPVDPLASVMSHVALATADIDPPPPQTLGSSPTSASSGNSWIFWAILSALTVCAVVFFMPLSEPPPPAPVMAPDTPAPAQLTLPDNASIDVPANAGADAANSMANTGSGSAAPSAPVGAPASAPASPPPAGATGSNPAVSTSPATPLAPIASTGGAAQSAASPSKAAP